MNKKLLTLLAVSVSGSLLFAQEAADNENEVYELSPFIVESDSDIGYLATSTLAGTRINSDIKDIGASVSVYTEEFIKDIDATKVEDILTYTTSGEGGGMQGNFGGFAAESSDEVRDNPSGVNRFRALAPATRTRDYFESTIPSDGYNFGRVTISRGPNAILAGTGSAGGVVDVTMNRAVFKDTNQIKYQYTEHGGHRGEMHFNRVLVDDRLAVRVDALAERDVYRQQPAYNEDERIYTAMTWRVREANPNDFFGRTTIRAYAEFGSIEGVPENMLTPSWSMASWFEGIDPRDDEPWAAPKWKTNGALRRTYDVNGYQNGSGTVVANSDILPGFPLYRQWGLVFADPNSNQAGVGLSGGLANVQGYQAVIPAGAQGPGGYLRSSGDRNRNRAGFYRTRLTNREVFDYYNYLLTGGLDFRQQNFQAYNIRLEQLLMGGKAGFEIAYDKQTFNRYRDFPISGGDNILAIDTNEYLAIRTDAYNTGGPLADQLVKNPHYGRPFIVGRDVFRDQRNGNDYESFQANAFIKHDFRESDSNIMKWLGKHTMNGLYFKTTQFNSNRTYRSTWSEDGTDLNFTGSLASLPGVFRTQVNGIFYVGESQEGAVTEDDIRLQPITAKRPVWGQPYVLRIYDEVSKEFATGPATAKRVFETVRDQKEDIESKALFLQSHWLDEHVVTLFGWRRDTSETFTSFDPPRDPVSGELVFDDLELVPASTQEKDSWTYSVVLKFPEEYLFDLPFDSDLRVHWNSSENFDPVGQRRNVFNEEVGSPEAETEEFGFSLTMFNGKLDLRVTKFETTVYNAAIEGIGDPGSYPMGLIDRMIGAELAGYTPQDPTTDPADPDGLEWSNGPNSFQTFEEVARAFYDALPQRLKDRIGPEFNYNPRFIEANGQISWERDNIVNRASLSNTITEGYEFELVYNPTRNWRIAVNVAQAEAVQADIAAEELAFVEEFLANTAADSRGLNNIVRNPGQSYEPWQQQYNNEHVYDLRASAAFSGTTTPEIREWRANLVTRYDFRDGILDGAFIGGAIRWSDKVGIGYPLIRDENGRNIADIDNPWYAPDTTYVDLNLGYSRNLDILGKDVRWNINLNIRNLFGEEDLIPVKGNADGTYGTVRIPPERTWTITNSFNW